MSQAEAATFVSELRRAFTSLGALPMPTIACVDGWVGGWALATKLLSLPAELRGVLRPAASG